MDSSSRSSSPSPERGPDTGDKRAPAPTPPSNRTVAQLREEADQPAALHFLARRGSEAERSTGDEAGSDWDEAMANAERDLAADAEWKRIQQNTFTRWANEHLRQAGKHIDDLATDLSDGLRLIALIEVLSGKRMPRHNRKPNFRSQKLENVSIALQFLEQEGVTLVNIDSTDIVDCKLKLILGLIWTLILHYAISMPMWDGPPLGAGSVAPEKTPKQRLMNWIQDKVPDLPVSNFTNDWKDGRAVGALVDSVAPGLCPDWDDWNPDRPVENAREAMDLADKWLNVPKLLAPEELVNPNVDEQSMMTYLSQFPSAKLRPGAPLRKKTNVSKVRAYGPGIEPRGLVAKAPAKFTVETFGAGDGEVRAEVQGGPQEKVCPCEVVFNNDRKKTFGCKYFPEEEGDYAVKVFFANREIPKSPFSVNVEGFAGDANKVTASGPGLEPDGVIINKPTFFHICAKDAGKGAPEVIVLDPKGRKDSVPVKITETDDPDVYKCEYVATVLGLHSVNVFFAGNPIPGSPYGVKVSPASLPNKVWTSGKGLQPNGIRVNETVDFKVHTENAGDGEVEVKILGPGGLPVRASAKKLDDCTTEYTYTPVKQGRHIVMVTFANQEIPRSPFEVNISPFKRSAIKAFGPGLKGGIVDKPAKFTVDTCGETGALGFNIKGPSQAQIACSDNGDGSADVEYLPTATGEYAIHILCDDEDIPGSPFMAQIEPHTDYDPDQVRVSGPGVENGVNPKEKTHFIVDTTDAGKAPLEVSIFDDLGEFAPETKEVSEGVFQCEYQPRKDQHKQSAMVNFGGVAVPGSPFRVQNDNPNDPSKVEIYGLDPDNARVRRPLDFIVDCTKSGPGDVLVAVDGPGGPSGGGGADTGGVGKRNRKKSSVPISLENNRDGTHKVTFEPVEPGPHTIAVTLDGNEVPQSPIVVDVAPAPDLSKIKIRDFEDEVFVDCTNEFEVDASALPDSDHGRVDCDIVGPSGEQVDCYVNKLEPEGLFNVTFVPFEEGSHDIGLSYDGEPLSDSPSSVLARYGSDPSRVKASGPGLDKAFVDEPNEFTVETKNAGAGSLGLAVEGPSEAVMNCRDNKDGTATVEYMPTEEGDYNIAIKFADEDIPGSPFKVAVGTRDGLPKPDARKVRAYGPGLEPGAVLPGKPARFTVDTSDTNPNAPISVGIRDPDGKKVGPREPVVNKTYDGNMEVSYVPPPVGEPYEICVLYNGDDIPGSPFQMTSNPNLEDVINSPRSAKALAAAAGGSRGGSKEQPELIYSKNGTGLQRKESKDGDASGGVADLVRNPVPGALGKERGGRPSDDSDDNFGPNTNKKQSDSSDSRKSSQDSSSGSRPGSGEGAFDSAKESDRYSRGAKSPNDRPDSQRSIGFEGDVDPNDDDFERNKGKRKNSSSSSSTDSRSGSRHGSKGDLVDDTDPLVGSEKTATTPAGWGRQSTADEGRGSFDGASRKGSRYGDSEGGRFGPGDDSRAGGLRRGIRNGYGADGEPLARSRFGDDRKRLADRRGSGLNSGTASAQYEPGGQISDRGPHGGDGGRRGSTDDNRSGPTRDRGPHGGDGGRRGSTDDNRSGPTRDRGPHGGDGGRRGSADDNRSGPTRDRGPHGGDGGRRGSTDDNRSGHTRDRGPHGGDGGRRGSTDDNRSGPTRDRGPHGSEGGRRGSTDDNRSGPTRDRGPHGGDGGRRGSADDSRSGPARKGSPEGSYGPGGRKTANDDSRYGPGGRIESFDSPYEDHRSIKDRRASNDGPQGRRGPRDDEYDKYELGSDDDRLEHGGRKGSVDAYGAGTRKSSNEGLNRGQVSPSGVRGAGEVPYSGSGRRESGDSSTHGVNDGPYRPGGHKMSDRSPSKADESIGDRRSSVDDVRHGLGSRKGSSDSSQGEDYHGRRASNNGLPGMPYGPGGRKESNDHDGKYGPGGRRGSSHAERQELGEKKGSGESPRASQHSPEGRKQSGEIPYYGGAGLLKKEPDDGTYASGPGGRKGPGGVPYYSGSGVLRKEPGVDDSTYASGPLGRKGSSEGLYGNLGPGSPYSKSSDASGNAKSPFGRGSSRPDLSDKTAAKSRPYDNSRSGSRPDIYEDRTFPPVELNNIPLPSTGGNVEAVITTPSGGVTYPYVEDNGNGSIGLSCQPNERGLHTIDVKYNDDHVQGSPYKFYASPLDDNKVHAYGPGLTHGVCGDPANFVISTRGAGAGGLALAVEGPSKADINCQDNKDGTVNVSYLPTAPGEYKISAKFADKHIEGSPFTCKVTGEGKKRNAISVGASSDLSLPDNLSSYDLRALSAYIVAPSGAEEPCFLKKLPKGNTGISFTPKEVGEHLVSVKRDGKHIKNSPFKINVSPGDVGDASKVKAAGVGLIDGRTHEDNAFHVDTRNAGYGGLSLSVEGPSKAEIKCNDHEDGTLDVSYRPTEPGLYIVNLKFADHHVPGSPFAVPVSGRGSKKEEEKIRRMREAVPVTEVGSQCRLTFKMPGINCKDLEASVSSPSSKVTKAAIAELEDGLFAVNFVPYELGIHTVSVQYHDIDIPGSPFQFTVGPLQDGGAHRVHAGGSGLERGVQGQPADFNVWTREAGYGSLAISVEGPSKAVVDFKDRKDGSCHVSYTVEEPGEYAVGIRFNDQHIPGSPYRVYIQPSADDAERVRLSNVAELPVKPDTPQTLLLNMNGADGDMECRIVAPSGREDDCFITPLGNGEHSVRFVPKEEGVHHLHARFNGVHIPGSPFKIVVGNNGANNDPSTVEVFGKGVQFGTTGERAAFTIDTSSVGAGTLSITVDGPSKVDLACAEVDAGYEVSYTPLVPGKYFVTVKYNGKNVSGSPFSVNVSGDNLSGEQQISRQRKSSRSSMTMETLKRTSYIRHQYTEQRSSSHHSISKNNFSDPSKVTCSGSGLRSARLNRHNSFAVDCGRAGNNILYVGVYGPVTPCDEVVIKHLGQKRYSVDYVVRERGKYIIFVKWGDDHVPGSPYHIEV